VNQGLRRSGGIKSYPAHITEPHSTRAHTHTPTTRGAPTDKSPLSICPHVSICPHCTHCTHRRICPTHCRHSSCKGVPPQQIARHTQTAHARDTRTRRNTAWHHARPKGEATHVHTQTPGPGRDAHTLWYTHILPRGKGGGREGGTLIARWRRRSIGNRAAMSRPSTFCMHCTELAFAQSTHTIATSTQLTPILGSALQL